MARPRASEQGPTARERMEQAFWDALAEKPFYRITVKEIAQRAGVNHNTFYYHYDNMEQLAIGALPDTSLSKLGNSVVGILLSHDEDWFGRVSREILTGENNVAALQDMYSKGRLILLNGSRVLINQLKQHIIATGLRILELDPATLTAEDRAAIEFLWGGLTAVLCSEACQTFGDYVETAAASIWPMAGKTMQAIEERHRPGERPSRP